MTPMKKILNINTADKTFYLVFLPVTFFIFTVAFLLILHPEAAFSGMKEGIDICLETVIPSLFPFLVISTLAHDLGIFTVMTNKAEKLMHFIFSLPPVALPIILMSLTGGFPVGAMLVEKAYSSGTLNRTQAQRMMLFCVNPGPAFVVLTVGYAIMGSVETGWIMYASITLSSLFTGIISRFFFSESDDTSFYPNYKNMLISPDIISKALNSSINSMMNICVWVVIFTCLGSLVKALPVGRGGLLAFGMLSEVTSGAITACENFSVPIVSAVISFAGFCVHFQVMPCIIKVRLKYKYFLSVRILSAALSCIFTALLLKLFPQYSQVISMGAKPDATSFRSSPFVCVSLMLMSGLFIIGDNYILKRKSAEKSDRRKKSLIKTR